MLEDMLRKQDGPTSNIPSPRLVDEIKKVHLILNQKMVEGESGIRRDLDQVAKELQEVSQTTETLMQQMSSRADVGTDWSCDLGRNGESEYLLNPKRRLEGPADAPNDRAKNQNEGFPIGGVGQQGDTTMGVPLSPLACK